LKGDEDNPGKNMVNILLSNYTLPFHLMGERERNREIERKREREREEIEMRERGRER
jgi:hypothetical protein